MAKQKNQTKPNQDLTKIWSKIIAKAWKDPAFKQKLMKTPREALREFGIELPKNVKYHVIEEKADTATLVIPRAPTNSEKLSEAEMEKIAGGTELALTGYTLPALAAASLAGMSGCPKAGGTPSEISRIGSIL